MKTITSAICANSGKSGPTQKLLFQYVKGEVNDLHWWDIISSTYWLSSFVALSSTNLALSNELRPEGLFDSDKKIEKNVTFHLLALRNTT